MILILIKSLLNKDKNNYYHNIFLEIVRMSDINMLFFDRTDISEGVDINKTRASKDRNIFHYCVF